MKRLQQLFNQVEQPAMRLAIIATIIIAAYLLILLPWQHKLNRLKHEVQQQQQLLNWMEPVVKTILITPKPDQQRDHSSSLPNLINQRLQEQGLASFLNSLEQPEKNVVDLVFNSIPFDTLMAFLHQPNGFKIKQINITATHDVGFTKVKLRLGKH